MQGRIIKGRAGGIASRYQKSLNPTQMKFSLSLVVAAFGVLFSTAKAQSIVIGYPEDGAFVTPGSNITVEVDRPVSGLS